MASLAKFRSKARAGYAGMNGLYDPDNLARPDFSQMVPFKPKVYCQKYYKNYFEVTQRITYKERIQG